MRTKLTRLPQCAAQQPTRPRGRPPRGLTKTGRQDRRCTTADKAVFEAGLSYTLRLYGFSLDEHAKALAARRFTLPSLPAGIHEAVVPTRPLRDWLRAHVQRTGCKASSGRSLIVSREAIGCGSLDRCWMPFQLDLWAEFWRSKYVEAKSSYGLGVFALQHLHAESTVARGVVDGNICWPETGVLARAADGRDAALFGPAALVNSACSDHCNAVLKLSDGVYSVVLSCSVEAGQEILVSYSQPGCTMSCPVCGSVY